MFRARIKLIRGGVMTTCFDKQFVRNEKTQQSELKLVNACRVLPPLENFDLKTMIEAGVDMKRQNSQLFDNRPTDLSQFEGKDVSESSEVENQPLETKE